MLSLTLGIGMNISINNCGIITEMLLQDFTIDVHGYEELDKFTLMTQYS